MSDQRELCPGDLCVSRLDLDDSVNALALLFSWCTEQRPRGSYHTDPIVARYSRLRAPVGPLDTLGSYACSLGDVEWERA